MKAVKRGQQFESFSSGKMFPAGTRSPMGGSPGSAYTLYASMGANTREGLETLFDHAEVFKNWMVLTSTNLNCSGCNDLV